MPKTVINSKKEILKKPFFLAAMPHIQNLFQNSKYLDEVLIKFGSL
jgi:hypothetical protein